MAKRDQESESLAAFNYLKANLDSFIDAINAEKADDVTLKKPASDAYFFDGFDTELPNRDPHIIFYPGSEAQDTAGNQSSEKITMGFELVISEQAYAGGVQLFKMLARYRRVIRDTMLAKWQDLRVLKVNNFPPTKFTIEAQGTSYWSIAVGFEFNLAG